MELFVCFPELQTADASYDIYKNKEINVSFLMSILNLKKETTKKCYFENVYLHDYKFCGKIIGAIGPVEFENIIAIDTGKIKFYCFNKPEYGNVSLGDIVSGIGAIFFDLHYWHTYSEDETVPNLYYNFKVEEIKLVKYKDDINENDKRWKIPELVQNNKAILEDINEAKPGIPGTDYILKLNSQGLENKIIPKTLVI